MDSSVSLDYAVFQLSPRRSRCELFVSGNGKTEKLASGLLKPFITHLKVAEEQAVQSGKVIKLEVERRRSGSPWFNKGTIERFVRFVSTPEVLELVNTFDAEMSQLEGARKIYSQGTGDPLSGAMGENETNRIAADTTKRELLKAIDVRLVALKQDLATACARASSAGFTLDNVSELLIFADYFGANRLNEACTKFISICQRWPELISYNQQTQSQRVQVKSYDDVNLRSSFNSDMSIDEPEVEQCSHEKVASSGGLQASNNQSTLSSSAESSGMSLESKPVQKSSVERPVEKVAEEPSVASSAPAGGGSSRRLSVQDRINLFESKKVQPANSGNSSNAGVSRVLSGKGEHRRVPSDFSEKSVLRRWSGASDMSIDLSSSSSISFNDRKESDSVGTPIVSTELQYTSRTESVETPGLYDTARSQSLLGPPANAVATSPSLPIPLVQVKSFPRDQDRNDEGSKTLLPSSILGGEKGQGDHHMTSSTKESQELADPYASQVQSKSFSGKGYGDGSNDHAVYSVQSKTEDHIAEDKATLPTVIQYGATLTKQVGLRNPTGEIQSQSDNAALKEKQTALSQSRSIGRKADVEMKTKGPSVNLTLKPAPGLSSQSDSPNSMSQEKIPRETEEVGVRDSTALSLQSFPPKTKEDSIQEGTNVQRPSSSLDSVKKVHDKREERSYTKKIGNPVVPVRKVKDSTEMVDIPTTGLVDQVPAVKPLKGNQELNDELQIKANELEKLFAAHKLRILNDQTPSSRRNKPIQEENVLELSKEGHHLEKAPATDLSMEVVNNEGDFNQSITSEMLDKKKYASNINPKLSKFSSDGIRGMFYEKYLKKRDAKLREEWGPKRAEKEAKMKALRDSLDCSQAEMKAKSAQSADKNELAYSHRRAERLKFFSCRSSPISRDQQAVQLVRDEEEDTEVIYEQGDHGRLGDDSSKSLDSKKIGSAKLLSSTPRISVATIPKPSFRSNSSSIKRRSQTENPLAESVPNFSDFRKENTKPTISKANTRVQSRSFYRSKSIIEETNLLKEDKPRRTQSMRKSTGHPSELKDLSPLASDSGNLASFGFLREQVDTTSGSRGLKSGDPKPFLRKGSGIGSAAGIAKLRASMASDIIKTEDAMHQQQASHDMVKDEEEDTSAEGDTGVVDLPVDSDSERVRQSPEFENSDDLGSENGALQAESDTVSFSLNFDANVDKLQESPVESPWNSCLQNPFSYAHDTSEFDASVDSPIGSPASWNSHRLNQIVEADANRMRKKWGSAQMPIIVANAPQQQRKDVTKGFKRLLKFGRKSRGVDSLLNDWVSASTASEGDDDTEDGRDLRPSDDFRASRMGFPLPPYDATHEVENFPEQVDSLCSSIPTPPANFKLREEHVAGSSLKAPRSFFSLSSFRNKGSESKLR